MQLNINLQKHTLLARGGQAEIYEFGNGKVLRIPTRPQDFERIRYEYDVYSYLSTTNASVPKVHDFVEINSTPAIIMERIDGISMMDQIKKEPFKAKRKSVELARLHLELLSMPASPAIKNAKVKAKFCILGSQFLSERLKQRLVTILEKLPDGNNFCHGDFHPGNIILHDGKYFIIDWSAAAMGDFHSDVAHTYLLLKVVPKLPNMNSLMHCIQRYIGKTIANTYLGTIDSIRKIDYELLSKWMLVKAAERTYYGLSSEKDQLTRFISKCIALSDSPRNENLFYKMI